MCDLENKISEIQIFIAKLSSETKFVHTSNVKIGPEIKEVLSQRFRVDLKNPALRIKIGPYLFMIEIVFYLNLSLEFFTKPRSNVTKILTYTV